MPSTGAMIYSALSVSAEGTHTHTHTHSARSCLRHPCISRHCGKMNVEREREPPFLPFSSPLSSSLIILRSLLPSVSLELYSHLTVFLSPHPTILSHRLFPLADRLANTPHHPPSTAPKPSQYDTKTDHTCINHHPGEKTFDQLHTHTHTHTVFFPHKTHIQA